MSRAAGLLEVDRRLACLLTIPALGLPLADEDAARVRYVAGAQRQ